MLVSIIIPCYNEEKGISNTYNCLESVLKIDSKANNYDYELIFVDDGSRDATPEKLREFNQKDNSSKYVLFSRNFGKEAAMLAGLKYAQGDAVVIIDADLQHPPELIPEMVEYYKDGYDQVIAKRTRDGEGKVKSFLSTAYYKLVNKMIDVSLQDGIGDFRLLSRRAVDALLSLEEYNRFSKGLFSWIGFKEKIISYENKVRVDGESKWSLRSLLNYGVDGVLSFNDKPLRSIIYLGIGLILMSSLYILINFIGILRNGVNQPGYFTTITAILLLGGIQLVSVGVIGEYIGRIYYEVKKRPHYIVSENSDEHKNHKIIEVKKWTS